MIVHLDAYITYIPSGEQVIYHDNFDIDTNNFPDHCGTWQYSAIFIWEDGNYRCDCNRALFFERAKTGDPEAWPETLCGEELYRLDKLIVRETGELLYSEPA